MIAMAKKKPNRSPAWAINTRIDPELKPCVEAYISSPDREFEPTLAQVLQKALKALLKEEGLWPPKTEKPK